MCACNPGDADPDGNRAITVPAEAIRTLPALDIVARVVDLQPAEDGRLWVLNSVAPYFVVLGPDGQVERQFGDRGGGPQEFDRPVALLRGVDPADIWAYDWGRHALIRISREDRRDLALPRDSLSLPSLVSFKGAGINVAPPWLEPATGGFLIARARITRDESALHLWNAEILRVRDDGSGARVDLHTPIGDFLGDPASRYGAATVLVPYPLWTLCADGTVGLYDPLSNSLRRFRDGQEDREPFALPRERNVQMTADLVFEMFYRQFAEDISSDQLPAKDEMRRVTESQNQEFVSSSAPFFPEFADLRCGADGAFWLQRFDATTGRLGHGPDWLRLSTNGSQTWVSLPRTFTTVRIERDRIWGTVRDDLGVQSIAWIEPEALR
jgi:hypothetical protein